MVNKKRHFRSSVRSRKRLLLSAVLIVVLLYSVVLLLVSVFALSTPYLVENIPYDFSVKDKLGVNVDSDSLHFGGGPAGVILQRSLAFTVEQDSRVVVSWDGPGSLSVDKNDFILKKGENTSIMFYLSFSKDLPIGDYNGTVELHFFES